MPDKRLVIVANGGNMGTIKTQSRAWSNV